MHATLNMNKIGHFASWDPINNKLSINGDKLTNADAGFYTIDISAVISNDEHTKTIIDKFRLEVRAEAAEIIIDSTNNTGNDTPKNVIYLSDWEGLIEQADD